MTRKIATTLTVCVATMILLGATRLPLGAAAPATALMPGTGDDVTMHVAVDGTPVSQASPMTVTGGQIVVVTIESASGVLIDSSLKLLIQGHENGTPLPPIASGLWIDPAAEETVDLTDPSAPIAIGPTTILAGGSVLTFVVPSGIDAFVLQAVSVDPMIGGAQIAATDAYDFVLAGS